MLRSWRERDVELVFREIDIDGDGLLSSSELVEATKRLPGGREQPQARIVKLVEDWDANGDTRKEATEAGKTV